MTKVNVNKNLEKRNKNYETKMAKVNIRKHLRNENEKIIENETKDETKTPKSNINKNLEKRK